ncbi:hypothetical protein ALNOE001_07040 [Candidatus Methanobinarius endosymbioticus]|uniref:PPM-type phosphatase domain-containing protein n=1 Tax=Candidatus Methanobinarius endosymbioticus TaxID=2006182 RepID=A0A366MBQ1_9EURY|nr:hypothetical protein ALNOE001_07040 [Candidatus Methanobinarius endosymbioticus]
MLPKNFSDFPNNHKIDIYAIAEPAKEVGGDFHDFFLIYKNKLAILIGDVSGKGIPAALFIVVAKTLIKNSAQSGNSPEEIFKNVNKTMCQDNNQNMFVTTWMGILKIDTGKFTFVNAGHNPPILIKNNNHTFLKSKPNFVLGGMENTEYHQNEIFLKDEEKIFLYTDGITEAINKMTKLLEKNVYLKL